MASDGNLMDRDTDQDGPITLGILNAVQDNSQLTQRSVASDLGIALGLANSYLKRCVRKGLVKVMQAPANRYTYYLTPHGFTEKSRLTAEYLTSSFTFYRRARVQCTDLVEQAIAGGMTNLALYRVSDLAEVMALCALESDATLTAVIDSTVSIDRFCGIPVVATLRDAGAVDAVVLSDLLRPQESYEKLLVEAGGIPVLHPPILGIVERPAGDAR